MSNLRLTFIASNFGPYNQVFVGSLLWDTGTNVLSELSLTGYGPFLVAPVLGPPRFSPPPANYPAGCLTFLNMGDPNGTRLQINFGDHGFLDQPLKPAPGTYNAPFDLWGSGPGNTPGNGYVVVTLATSIAPPPPENLQ